MIRPLVAETRFDVTEIDLLPYRWRDDCSALLRVAIESYLKINGFFNGEFYFYQKKKTSCKLEQNISFCYVSALVAFPLHRLYPWTGEPFKDLGTFLLQEL